MKKLKSTFNIIIILMLINSFLFGIFSQSINNVINYDEDSNLNENDDTTIDLISPRHSDISFAESPVFNGEQLVYDRTTNLMGSVLNNQIKLEITSKSIQLGYTRIIAKEFIKNGEYWIENDSNVIGKISTNDTRIDHSYFYLQDPDLDFNLVLDSIHTSAELSALSLLNNPGLYNVQVHTYSTYSITLTFEYDVYPYNDYYGNVTLEYTNDGILNHFEQYIFDSYGDLYESDELTFVPGESYLVDANLLIYGNQDVEFYATLYGYAGDGSSGNPYIIDGLDINAGNSGDGLFLFEIDDYMVIQNSNITNSDAVNYDAAIKLLNCKNIQISNNNLSRNNGRGITLFDSNFNINITNNTISDNGESGLFMMNSHGCLINNNSIENNGYTGVYVLESNENQFEFNEVLNNFDDGMKIGFSNSNVIENNTVQYNGYGLDALGDGIGLWGSNHSIIKNNNVNYNFQVAIRLFDSIFNMVMENNASNTETYDGISLQMANDNTILNNFIFNNFYGMRVHDSNFNLISSNEFISNTYMGLWIKNESQFNSFISNQFDNNSQFGIYVTNCSNNFLFNNTILNTQLYEAQWGHAIYLDKAGAQTFQGNYIEGNLEDGIWLRNSNNSAVYGNYITGNRHGIVSYESYGSQISGNNVSENLQYGIVLLDATSTTVNWNTIVGNGDQGLRISAGSIPSSGNLIYRNTIANNTNYQCYYRDAGQDNTWESDGYGNYWGDYLIQNPTAGNNGIYYDTAYQMNGSSVDYDYKPLIDIPTYSAPSSAPTLDPINPSVSSNGTFALNWNTVVNAQYYKVYQHDSPITTINETVILKEVTSDTSSSYYIPDNGNKYYAVIATNFIGDSSISNCEQVTINIAPTIPFIELYKDNVQVSNGVVSKNGKVTINWNSTLGADEYHVFQCSSPITTINGSVTELGTTEFTTFEIANSINGTYYIAITSENVAGNSSISNNVYYSAEVLPIKIYPISDVRYFIGDDVEPIEISILGEYPGYYSISKDGIVIPVHDNQTWVKNEIIYLNISDLSTGKYTYEINVSDENGYLVTESVNVYVSDGIGPSINNSGNVTFNAGQNVSPILWNISSNNSDFYTLYKNGTPISGYIDIKWVNNETIIYDVKNLDIGTHEFKLIAYDEGKDYNISIIIVQVLVNLNSPEILEKSDNIIETVGYSSFTISWLAVDDDDPTLYWIYLYNNSELLDIPGYGVWSNNSYINFTVPEGYSPSIYTYQIRLYDSSLNSRIDNITINILPLNQDNNSPNLINSSSDLILESDYSDIYIYWNFYDENPYNYSIYLIENESLIETGFWNNSSPISFEIPENLEIGEYNFQIIVMDTSNNMYSDNISVTVTQKSGDGTDNNNDTDNNDNSLLIVIGSVAGGIAVISSVVIVKKRSRRGDFLPLIA